MNVVNPGEAPTKEAFFPAGYGTNVVDIWGYAPIRHLALANDLASVAFLVPHDFNTLLEAVLCIVPAATQAAADWDLNASYGSPGQVYNVHNEFDNVETYNVTNNELFEMDIALVLTALAAGDRGGVTITLGNALHDAYVLGMRLRYL